MPLSPGTRLGPYEIVDALGEGGMGEVYRARDTRLDRTVALKVIRSSLTADYEFRQRFEREARAISGLSHPNICTLHDVGHHDGADFLVMEYLDGEPLSRRLARGPLPLELAVRCALQIAEALDNAHAHGIVHRDLKPANIMLTKSGGARGSSPGAKLLDFGLAKLHSSQAPLEPGAFSATASAPHEITSAGAVIGTLHYMAPEQLEGRPADARADIFALGAVLHEMITGRRAFDGATPAAVIAAILRSDPPPLRTLQPHAPPVLEHLVTVCLAKDAEGRWSSARDIVLMLRGIQAQSAGTASVSSRTRDRQWLPWVVAAAALVFAAVLGFQRYLRTEPPLDVRHLEISPPPGATLDFRSAPQISPDGTRIAFVAIDGSGHSRLYVRALDAIAAEALPDTEGALQPFWSPDSKSLGFFANARLKTVVIAGGRPRTLATAAVPRGGTWSQQGLILFVPNPPGRVHQVPASGGEATAVETLPPSSCWFPVFLPDGRQFLCTGVDPSRRVDGIYVASLDWSETKRLVSTTAAGAAITSGHLLYRREAELVAQRIDLTTLEVSGTPVPVAPDVAANPLSYQGLFSSSSEGTVAYLASAGGSRLVWYDRAGKELSALGARGNYNSLCLSNDEQRLFVDQADPSGNVDIWMLDAVRGAPTRLTFDAAVDFYPVCSGEGREIVFGSLRGGRPNLYHQQTSAPGNEQVLLALPTAVNASQWTRDGRFLIYRALHATTSWDVWVLPLSGDRRPFPFTASVHDERFGRLSDDGRWMAYGSNQTGTFEIYVRPFPAGGATWQVSRGGGTEPQWRPDGKELFYLSTDKKLMAVDVTSRGAELHFGTSRALFSTYATAWEGLGSQYIAASNGKRFLVNRLPDDAAAMPVSVILNWTPGRER